MSKKNLIKYVSTESVSIKVDFLCTLEKLDCHVLINLLLHFSEFILKVVKQLSLRKIATLQPSFDFSVCLDSVFNFLFPLLLEHELFIETHTFLSLIRNESFPFASRNLDRLLTK